MNNNLIEFIPKDKYKQFLNIHVEDNTELSAQNVLWDNSRIDPIMYNQAKNPFGLPPIKNEGGTYEIDPACINRKVSGYKPEIEDSQLIPYKSLIRKIFDWLMVKGI